MDIEGLDVISVSDEAVINFQKWFNVKDIKDNLEFPLDKGVLVLRDSSTKIKFTVIEEEHVRFKAHAVKDNEERVLQWERIEGKLNIITDLDPIRRLLIVEVIAGYETFLYLTLHYMSNTPERVHKTTEKRKVIKAKKSRKKAGRKGKRVTYVTNSKYYVDMPKEFSEKGKREYKREIESWKVRGHWRTYKNGKKVWIKPHVRGEGKAQPKEYRLK